MTISVGLLFVTDSVDDLGNYITYQEKDICFDNKEIINLYDNINVNCDGSNANIEGVEAKFGPGWNIK